MSDVAHIASHPASNTWEVLGFIVENVLIAAGNGFVIGLIFLYWYSIPIWVLHIRATAGSIVGRTPTDYHKWELIYKNTIGFALLWFGMTVLFAVVGALIGFVRLGSANLPQKVAMCLDLHDGRKIDFTIPAAQRDELSTALAARGLAVEIHSPDSTAEKIPDILVH